MKAIISCTNDPVYSFFLPIVAYCWNKLDVDVIAFTPDYCSKATFYAMEVMNFNRENRNLSYGVIAKENKAATYSQCARLYAACLDLPEDEILVTSDVDMAVFRFLPYQGGFTVLGTDLVPNGQLPMCFISANVKNWRDAFHLHGKTYQQCLDETIGKEECTNMRGNLWARDQETAFKKITPTGLLNGVSRSNGQNQFATKRVDRDDAYWRERVTLDLIDAHLWRPGYEPQNLSNLLELLQMMYPNDNFDWLINYTEKYRALL
jgi:hypothetical protein